MKFTPVSRRRGPVAKLRPMVMALLGAGLAHVALGQTLPAEMVNMFGGGTLNTSADQHTMTLTQTSNRALWETSNFSIGAGYTFAVKADPASLTMVRVTGYNQASLLNGTLAADNHFMLINPGAGIYVGGQAVLQGADLLFTTKDLRADQVADNYAALQSGAHVVFDGSASSDGYGGNIYGYGGSVDIEPGATLKVGEGGTVMLIGDNVRNQGTIATGNGGHVNLLAVASAEVDIGDSGFITLSTYTGDTQLNRVAVNTGTISAPDGDVTMVGTGGESEGNAFVNFDVADPVDALYTSGYTGNYASGAFNSGTIEAKRSDGGVGQVSLIGEGSGSVAGNIGTIDVSSIDGLSMGGGISMQAETVRVGLYGGKQDGQLLADGLSGGNIVLGDRNGSASTHWVYVSDGSVVSANASDTGVGDGGQISLTALYTAPDGGSTSRYDYGQVEAYGQFQAQGGVAGGSGGTLTTFAPAVNVAYGGMSADINVSRRGAAESGQNGVWAVGSTNITVGGATSNPNSPGHYEPGSPQTLIDPGVISNTLRGGADVSLAATSDPTGNWSGQGTLYVSDFTSITSSGEGVSRLDMRADRDITLGSGTSITVGEGGGSLNVNIDAKNGALTLDGYQGSLTQSSEGDAPVTIWTHGGDLTLSGNASGRTESSAAVGLYGVDLDASGSDAQGQLAINGTATGGSQDGVAIMGNSSLYAGNMAIQGNSPDGAGVRVDSAALGTAQGGIVIHGAASSSSAEGQGVGVAFGQDVSINVGQGQATVLGRAASGDGIAIDSLTMTTSGGVASERQRFTLAGESVADGMGIRVTGTPGLQLHDEAGASLAAAADVVIGATASAASPMAMDLGTPSWNTTGRLNFRPIGVNEGMQMVEALNTVIRVGADAGGLATNFVVQPGWYNNSVNAAIQSVSGVVIGSDQQAGLISVADEALSNMAAVSLQNQASAGSGGIALGAQSGKIGKLNLLTTGDVTQSGPINVGELNFFLGQASSVQLTNPANQIGALNVNGSSSPAVAAQAAPSSTAGAQDILAFASAASAFQTLQIAAPEGRTGPDIPSPEPFVPRPFEGPDALSDLRTDVYVHGHLSRPQICTAANTAGVAGPAEAPTADPLALEWTKVRRGAQLSNCSGLQADANCSAF